MKNAERVLSDIRGARRHRPKERDVWIRVEGEWQLGEIEAWFTIGTRWFASILHDEPGEQTSRRLASYWHDPLTIVPRREGERPIG
jgi:hypothetical protein